MGVAEGYSGFLAHILAETRGERSYIIGVNLRVVRGSRDRHVGEAVVDKLRVNLRVHVHQYALRRETLRAVRSHGVAVIEVSHLVGIEAHDSVFCAIHANADLSVIPDVLDGAEVTVGNLQVPVRGSKLYFVPDSELPLDLTVRGDAAQT